jgi:hypothetical protein
VDPATTQQVETPAAPTSIPDLSTLSPVERQTWRDTGNLPKKADSATAKKESTQADSSTAEKDKKVADTASDSATDKDSKPHLRTKEDSEKRFKEILDELKTLRQQNDDLKRGKTSDTRDAKQESQPAAEVKVPALKKFLDDFFTKAENKGKSYEDGVEAWTTARDVERGKQLEQQLRTQIAQEAAQKELDSRVAEAKKRYPDFDERIQPAVKTITDDQQIPFAVKAVMNDSPVFVDLMYVLAEPKALADLIQTAKTNPAAAIRKIVLTEQLVQAELAKAKTSAGADGKDKTATEGDGKTRDASGKFVANSDTSQSSKEKTDAAASEPISRAPKPPTEVGGRATALTDDEEAALKASPGKLTDSAKQAMMRRYAERHK